MTVSTNNGACITCLCSFSFWAMNLLGVFSILSRKGVSGSRLHGVCMGRSGTSVDAVYALIRHFCYVGGFGDLGDPVLPTLRV